MKSALFSFVFFAANSIFAASIAPYVVCQFTEPFITVKVDFAGNRVIEKSLENPENKIYAVGSSDVFNQYGVRILTYGENILKIDYTTTGSDGMSDKVFEFEGILNPGKNELFGGCEFSVK